MVVGLIAGVLGATTIGTALGYFLKGDSGSRGVIEAPALIEFGTKKEYITKQYSTSIQETYAPVTTTQTTYSPVISYDWSSITSSPNAQITKKESLTAEPSTVSTPTVSPIIIPTEVSGAPATSSGMNLLSEAKGFLLIGAIGVGAYYIIKAYRKK